jgi:hypothetical protein
LNLLSPGNGGFVQIIPKLLDSPSMSSRLLKALLADPAPPDTPPEAQRMGRPRG